MPESPNRYAPLDATTKRLRWLCVVYMLLLILEGALRKWFLPAFSDLLLLARDPVVLLAYLLAFSRNRFPKNKYILAAGLLMAFWSAATLLIGHQNLGVTAFGIRANFLHLPMAFIMGSVFYRQDVISLGKWWLLGTLAMTAIIILQFSSPQSAWINQGVGGVGSAGFSGALGRYRPPGTFSFIVGVVWFYTFSTAFLVAGLTQHTRYPKWLLLASAAAIIVAIPVSISRTLILSAALTFAVGVFASSLQKNAIFRFLRILLFGIVGVFIAGQFAVFDEAKEAFVARWERSTGEDAGGVEGAIIWRLTNEFLGPFVRSQELPLLGEGIGAGTQVGTKLLTGTRGFSLGEGEWFRLTAEGGIVFGGLYILWRVLLLFALAKFAIRAYFKGNGLGLIFLSTLGFNLLIGQFGQSTILGFTVVGIGLLIASIRLRPTIPVKTDAQSLDQKQT